MGYKMQLAYLSKKKRGWSFIHWQKLWTITVCLRSPIDYMGRELIKEVIFGWISAGTDDPVFNDEDIIR